MSLSQMPKQTTGEKYNGLARDEFGFKMLHRMGWSEGTGLGAQSNGIVTCVKVKKRRELTGLGADFAENSKHNWTVNTSAFDQVLAGLNEIHKDGSSASDEDSDESAQKLKKKDKTTKPKDGEDIKSGKGSKSSKRKEKLKATEEEEDSDASRGEVKRRAKKAKKEAKKKAEAQSESEDEEVKNEKAGKKGEARGLPQGRYQKRELNKNVRSYSNKDLSAILGMAEGAGDWPISAELAVSGKMTNCNAEEQRQSKPSAPTHCSIVIEAPADPAREAVTALQRAQEEAFFRLPPGWWGAGVFRSAGRLGGGAPLRVEDKGAAEKGEAAPEEPGSEGSDKKVIRFSETERGFSEADQERLYLATHSGATTGRAGLGIQDRPKKVAGARWTGTKSTSFEDVEEVIPSEDGGQNSDGKRIKWKKLAASVLDDSKKGKITLKKIAAKVLAKIKTDKCEKKLKEEMLEKLRGSSQFAVCDQYVQYSASELKRKSSSGDVAGLSKKNSTGDIASLSKKKQKN